MSVWFFYVELPEEFAHTTTAPPVKKSKFKEKRAEKAAERHGHPITTTTPDPEEAVDSMLSYVVFQLCSR